MKDKQILKISAIAGITVLLTLFVVPTMDVFTAGSGSGGGRGSGSGGVKVG